MTEIQLTVDMIINISEVTHTILMGNSALEGQAGKGREGHAGRLSSFATPPPCSVQCEG